MSNSSLVCYTQISPNRNSPRTHSIDRITPHCIVGQLQAEDICACFRSTDWSASCNYGIGTDGSISMCVEEGDRSWCSSSSANDDRAVTIECACDKTDPYTMNGNVYESLINLCTDICKRNGKTRLLWFADKDVTLSYNPQPNEMVITVHRWFKNKACPGDWLYNRLGELAAEVTRRLMVTVCYRVRKSWADSGSQIGAYNVLEYAKIAADTHPGYSVYDDNGYCVYTGSVTPYLVKVTDSALNIRSGAGTDYGVTGVIRDYGIYTIVAEADGKGATKWGKLLSGAGWISLDFTRRV